MTNIGELLRKQALNLKQGQASPASLADQLEAIAKSLRNQTPAQPEITPQKVAQEKSERLDKFAEGLRKMNAQNLDAALKKTGWKEFGKTSGGGIIYYNTNKKTARLTIEGARFILNNGGEPIKGEVKNLSKFLPTYKLN